MNSATTDSSTDLMQLTREIVDMPPSFREKIVEGKSLYLGLWAIEVLKRNLPISVQLIKLIAREEMEQEYFLFQLACTLINYRHGKDNTSNHGRELEGTNILDWNIIDGLAKAINMSAEEYYDNLENQDTEFFAFGTMNISRGSDEIVESLPDEDFKLDSKVFVEISSLLRELGKNGYAQAQYLLAVTGDTTEDWLVKASNQKFLLASYRLGFRNCRENPREAIKHLNLLDIDQGNDFDIDESLITELRKNAAFQRRALQDIAEEKELAEHQIAEERARSEATENMMAMFAHQFRGSVGSIVFNAEHQHDESLYLSLARSMNGLLDIFSSVSSTPEKLVRSLKADSYGDSTPETVLLQALKLVLVQLVSKRSQQRISPFYLAYAKRLGMVSENMKQSDWNRNEWRMEEQIQKKWEQEISELMKNGDTQSINQWMTINMLPMQLSITEEQPITFSKYGVKESLLIVIFTEILLNAIKHTVPGTEQPLSISWNEEGRDIVFFFGNPSTKYTRQREKSKGSGRGHQFLKMIANHIGGQFNADVFKDDSEVKMVFPIDLMRESGYE